MDPPEFSGESFEIGGLSHYLSFLGHLSTSTICPICTSNTGWVRPPGLESITLPTNGPKPLEALPYMCDKCGFLRLHLISQYQNNTDKPA